MRKPLFGVVHLHALPGSAGWRSGSVDDVLHAATADAQALLEGGVDGLVVENFGDAPFRKGVLGDPVAPAVTAAMAVIARQLGELTRLPLCVNVLRNDACAALGVAAACGARSIRVNVLNGAFVTDQGVIEGEAPRVLSTRRALGLEETVEVWADLLVKHAAPLAPVDPVVAAKDLAGRAGADVVLMTGTRTGEPLAADELDRITAAIPDTRVFVASGLSVENAAELLPRCHGAIVGTGVKHGGDVRAAVDPERVRALRRAVDGAT